MKQKFCKNTHLNTPIFLIKNGYKLKYYCNLTSIYPSIKRIAITAACLIFFIACHEKESKSVITTFEADKITQKTVKIQEMFPKFTIVPLETNEKSLIQYIKKIILYGDCIYVLDDQRPLFAVFSINGKLVKTIGRQGHGPGEFYVPTDFIIDPKTKQIELYDGFGRKILIYDLEGKFLKSVPVSVDGDYFVKFEDESYLIYTNMRNGKRMPFKLIRIDKGGKIITKEFPYSQETVQTTYSPFVQIGADKYIFSEHLNDTIYQITQKEIHPFIYINMGKEGMPFENRVDIISANAVARKYSRKTGSPMIFNNKILIPYSRNSNSRYICFNPDLSDPNYYKVTNSYDFAFGTPDFSSDNKLIGIIHPSSINLHKKDGRYALQYRVGDKIPEMEELRKNLKEMDNPCLIIWDEN